MRQVENFKAPNAVTVSKMKTYFQTICEWYFVLKKMSYQKYLNLMLTQLTLQRTLTVLHKPLTIKLYLTDVSVRTEVKGILFWRLFFQNCHHNSKCNLLWLFLAKLFRINNSYALECNMTSRFQSYSTRRNWK